VEHGDELKQAEAHLTQAEADLGGARTLEHAAEHEVDEALHEIRDIENNRPDAHHVAVEVATDLGVLSRRPPGTRTDKTARGR
jgi:hypothetical protein